MYNVHLSGKIHTRQVLVQTVSIQHQV